MMLIVLIIGVVGGYWGGSQKSDAFSDKTNLRIIHPPVSSDTSNRNEPPPAPLENASDPSSAGHLKAAENGSKLVLVDYEPETIRKAPPAQPKTIAVSLKGNASLSVKPADADQRPEVVKSNPLPASKRRAKDSAAEDGFENEKPPDSGRDADAKSSRTSSTKPLRPGHSLL